MSVVPLAGHLLKILTLLSTLPQSTPPSQPPASYHSALSPSRSAQPNFDQSNPQRAVAKSLHGDLLIRANTNTGPAMKSQANVGTNGPVVERPAPQPPTALKKQSATVKGLANKAGTTLRRREKMETDKSNDADIVDRLQGICKDADPTRLYRNLVKIGQG